MGKVLPPLQIKTVSNLSLVPKILSYQLVFADLKTNQKDTKLLNCEQQQGQQPNKWITVFCKIQQKK